MGDFFERLWVRLRPFASPGAAVTSGYATYSSWDDLCSWIFGNLQGESGQWFLRNIAVLPAWGAATIVGAVLFALIAWVQYRSAATALKPKLQISIPHKSSKIKGRFADNRAQWLYVALSNIGTDRLTNIELYIHDIRPHHEIAAAKDKYKLDAPKELNGQETERVCLIKSGIKDTVSAIANGEGPLLPKETEITLYLRASAAGTAAIEFIVKQKPDGAGGVVLVEKKWWQL